MVLLLLLLHPELVVVPAEVFIVVELLVVGDALALQHPVHALGGEDGEGLPEPVIDLLPEERDHHGHGLGLDGVQDGLHRDVAGHVPQDRVPVTPVDLVAEHAVEHHVQVGAVEDHQVLQVLTPEVGGVVENVHAVGADGGSVQIHLIAQPAQGQIQKAHGEIELVARGG